FRTWCVASWACGRAPPGGLTWGLMRLGRFRKPGDLVVQLAVLNGSAEGVDLVSINALGDALPERLGREPLVPAGPVVLVKHRHDLAVAPVVPTVHVGEQYVLQRSSVVHLAAHLDGLRVVQLQARSAGRAVHGAPANQHQAPGAGLRAGGHSGPTDRSEEHT